MVKISLVSFPSPQSCVRLTALQYRSRNPLLIQRRMEFSTNNTNSPSSLEVNSTAAKSASTETKIKKDDLRPAATIILIRPTNTKKTLLDNNFEILMVKRSTKARFFPGAHVFPGGLVEESDSDSKWKELLGVSQIQQFVQINVDGTKVVNEFAFRVAAIRELFEEVNVLMASSTTNTKHINNELVSQWRPLVQKDSSKFFDMCKELGLVPQVLQLFPYAHWITPKQEKYRYNTLFYVGIMDSSTQVESQASHDRKETTEFDWFTPEQALSRFKDGSIFLPPPTWYTLLHLVQFGTIGSLQNQLKKQVFTVNIPIVLPEILFAEEAEKLLRSKGQLKKDEQVLSATVLPGDEYFPRQDPSMRKQDQRHRIMVISSGTGAMRYELDCNVQYSFSPKMTPTSKL